MFKLFRRKPKLIRDFHHEDALYPAWLKLFRIQRVEKDELDKLKSRADRGAKLRYLKENSNWAEVERLRDLSQQNAVQIAMRAGATDKDRFQASIQFSTLEGFFSEIARRIEEGEKAERELEERRKATAKK